MRLLIDANIYRKAAAGAYVHVNDELMMWGPRIIATRRYQYRFRAPSKRTNANEARYIPALALHGRDHGAEFFKYWLIDYEMMDMPPAFDWVGRSIEDLFKPILLPRRPPSYGGILISSHDSFDFQSELRKFIQTVDDERFNEILRELGEENSQDAFHVWTCEREGLDCIVALDGPFQGRLRQARKKLSLKVDVRPPSEICRKLKIAPVDNTWFEASDVFRTTRLRTLFDRHASWKDQILFKAYRACCGLAAKLNYPVDFVIAGYEDSVPRAPEFRGR